ncbi:hypothetical protein Ahy_Scaffold6g108083 [Arachis hypogaea]|uniref:PB1-like domain-containing protein n=1 Tax=Arachis hypogaea TaxID=3818 RepID=A0A444WPU2_ARAHY|nr:hypothetical protein Ahy_Scaffold6g108083 [Arachis hypogaea]
MWRMNCHVDILLNDIIEGEECPKCVKRHRSTASSPLNKQFLMFETDSGENVIYTSGLYDEWVGVDENYFDMFAVTSYYRKLRYDKAEACWFLDPKDGLEFSLRRLQVDQDLINMIRHCHENNNVIHVYFEHGPLVPDIIDVMEFSETKDDNDHAIGRKVGMEGMEEVRVEINKEPVHLNIDSSSYSYRRHLYKPHMPLECVNSNSNNDDDVGPSSDRRTRKAGNDNDKCKKKATDDEDVLCPLQWMHLIMQMSWKSDELKTPSDSEDNADPAVNPSSMMLPGSNIKGVRNYTLQKARGVRYKKNDTTRCRVNGCFKTFNDDHTCERTFKNRCATRSWITDILIKKVRKLPTFRHYEGLPCCHAIAVISVMNGRPENYVHAWLTMGSYNKTYEYHINLVRGQELWETSQYLHCLPPVRSKPRGRPSHYARKKCT